MTDVQEQNASFGGMSIDYFFSVVEKQPGPNGCWLWRGSNNGRYGRIGRKTYAHRLCYELHHGPIPPGYQVMHKCDTPLCVRPDHLTVGTPGDNTRDAMRKGRLATGDRHGLRLHPERIPRGERHGTKTHPESISRGEDRPAAKLTEEQVREIRWLSDLGETRTLLAKRYGVTPTVIRRIAQRRSWKHVK